MKLLHSSFAFKIMVISSICILTACSGMEGARKGAGLISAFTVDVQNQLTVFADSRLKIDQLRLDNINGLEENAIDTAQRNSIEIDIWRMKHLGSKTTDHRILFFEAIRASTEEAAKQQLEQEQLRAERARAIQAMKSAINFDAAKLAKVSKNLADLAKTENFKAQANFLIEFVGEVRKSIRELEEDAEKQVEKAENEASETTNEQDNTSGT